MPLKSAAIKSISFRTTILPDREQHGRGDTLERHDVVVDVDARIPNVRTPIEEHTAETRSGANATKRHIRVPMQLVKKCPSFRLPRACNFFEGLLFLHFLGLVVVLPTRLSARSLLSSRPDTAFIRSCLLLPPGFFDTREAGI